MSVLQPSICKLSNVVKLQDLVLAYEGRST